MPCFRVILMESASPDAGIGVWTPYRVEGCARLLAKRPWLLAIYLLAVSVTVFVLPRAYRAEGVVALLALQLLALASFRKLDADVFRNLGRLRLLFLFLVVIYAVFPYSADDQWKAIPLPWLGNRLAINLTGIRAALVMCGVVLAGRR